MRLLICAGGTGGGVYPALSVLQALLAGDEAAAREQGQPASETKASIQVLWIGGERGMEADLVKREGIPFASIPAAGVHGVGWRALPGNLLQLAKGFRASRRILRQYRPDVLFFTGGYVAVPMALAARLPARGYRTPRRLVYIPDIEPGQALKVLSRFANALAVTVEASKLYLPVRAPVYVTGYPVREGLKKLERSAACRVFGLKPELPVFLVLGGSKGARSINRALRGFLPEILKEMQVIHVSGQLDWEEVSQSRQELNAELAERYQIFPYIHEEMGAAFSAADLVLSRAGASCLGELPLFGLPAILVPYPYAWRYQMVNAQYLEQAGAAVTLMDAELQAKLLQQIRSLMSDSSRRLAMQQAMSSLSKPGAARTIARILREMNAGAH